MKTIFEEMGGTYRQVGDYFIPNITLPDDGEQANIRQANTGVCAAAI